jgi:hypothetical protein
VGTTVTAAIIRADAPRVVIPVGERRVGRREAAGPRMMPEKTGARPLIDPGPGEVP